MREVLFRGRRLDNGEWVYGDLEHNAQGEEYIRCWYCGAYQACKIVPDTRGEYTGLIDKNGVKIFEGDLILVGGAKTPVYVEFIDFSWMGVNKAFGPYYRYRFFEYEPEYYEVIGNIHDNPELLGESK